MPAAAPEGAPNGRTCGTCGIPLVRKRFPTRLESCRLWKRRRYCGHKCLPGRPREPVVTLSAHRARAKKHRKWLCERCGHFPVDSHHKDGNPLNDDPSNVETLCRSCHAEADAALRRGPMPWEWKRG